MSTWNATVKFDPLASGHRRKKRDFFCARNQRIGERQGVRRVIDGDHGYDAITANGIEDAHRHSSGGRFVDSHDLAGTARLVAGVGDGFPATAISNDAHRHSACSLDDAVVLA